MAFDECPSSVASREYVQASVDRTTRWLQRCKDEMARLNSLEDTVNPHQLLFGINQGAIYDDIRIAPVSYTHLDVYKRQMVHSETTSGILNDIEAVGKVVKERGRTFIVDAMSSFGGVDIPVKEWGINFLVSSANKCIQGVPGFSFIIGNKQKVIDSKGKARSLSLDLYDPVSYTHLRVLVRIILC